MRQLVVNADDFGRSPMVNAAILRAFREGIVTSASLMVTGEAFDQAVALAHDHPGLAVGLHLVLILGHACLPLSAIPDIVDRNGHFPANPVTAGLRWFFQPAAREQIRRELQAQIERFRATGLALDHLNSHLHFHVHPTIFDVLLELAEANGIRCVRLPDEPWRLSLRLDPRRSLVNLVYALILGLFAHRYRRRLVSHGFTLTDGVFGLLQTGHLTTDYMLRLLEHLPDGTYELYAHPDLDSPAGRAELAALIAPPVRAGVEAQGIQLTTYTRLATRSPLS